MHFVKIGLPLDIMLVCCSRVVAPWFSIICALPLQICFKLRGFNSYNLAVLTHSSPPLTLHMHPHFVNSAPAAAHSPEKLNSFLSILTHDTKMSAFHLQSLLVCCVLRFKH